MLHQESFDLLSYADELIHELAKRHTPAKDEHAGAALHGGCHGARSSGNVIVPGQRDPTVVPAMPDPDFVGYRILCTPLAEDLVVQANIEAMLP